MENMITENFAPEQAAVLAEHAKKPRRRKVRESRSDRIYYAIVYIVLGLLAAIVIYPLYFVVIASFSSADAVLAGPEAADAAFPFGKRTPRSGVSKRKRCAFVQKNTNF